MMARNEGSGRTDPPDRGPGASSGHESQPQERIVPGTGTAAEGYDNQGDAEGTRDGDPLAGVEADTGEEGSERRKRNPGGEGSGRA
jgi:hypothetical protein